MSVKATIQSQLKGNLTDKFGDNLPIPFIEKVKIEGDAITVQAAIYFNLDSYSSDNFDSFLAELGDLRFYAMMAYDRIYTNTTGSDLITNNAYSDIVAGTRDVLSNLETSYEYVLYNSASSYPELIVTTGYPAHNGNLYDMGTLDEWTVVDTYYDDMSRPVKKLINSVSFTSEISRLAAVDGSPRESTTITTFDNAWENGYSATSSNDYSGSNLITNAGFITFSSILNLNDTTASDGDYTEADDAYDTGDSIRHLFGSLTSDMNYVSFFKDGAINETKQLVYVRANGEIVPDAIQSLNGKYYAPFKISLPKIVALFKAVSAPPVVEETQSALSVILTESAEDSTLLTKINLYLNTFFEKSSATPLGRYYLDLRKRLAAIDLLVREGPPCTKQVVTNPIVEDFRGSSYVSDYSWSDLYGPAYSLNDPGEYIYTPSVYMQRMTGSLSVGEVLVVDKGYLFFDYEKALKQQSNLAHLLDVQKIEDYFGHNALTSKFNFETAEMTVYRTSVPLTLAGDDDGPRINNYSNGEDISIFTTSKQYNMTLNFDDSKPNIPKDIDYDLIASEMEYYWIQELDGYGNSYLKLRNFNLPISGALAQSNGRFHKLMCYEFQNILDGDALSTDESLDPNDVFAFNDMLYRFRFEIDDNTLEVFDALRAYATGSLESFEEYAEIALDHCSYNDVGNVFNQFFIDAVEQKFGSDPKTAPFLIAPLIYNYCLDIFTNAFDGDRLEIFEATRKLSDTIAPYAGTADAIETFIAEFQKLIDDWMFDTGEQIYAAVGGAYPNDGSVGSGPAPSQFIIQSTIVEQLYPVGVDLSEYSEASEFLFSTMTEESLEGAPEEPDSRHLYGNTGGSLVDQLGSSYDPNWSNVKP